MDLVFKALADNSRRELLDRLHIKDGQTLRALCADLAMTRQAVTKHLVQLEEAGLVTVTWQGREKFHHLNPTPLRQIFVRWIDKYERLQPVATIHPQVRVSPSAPPEPIETEGENRWTNLHAL
jgi:DNA-binding transcriptional ArsR family regulator